MDRLDRTDYVMAVLSTAQGRPFTPVQLQKLFFLLDARASDQLDGKYFQFAPYDYGPFDSDVYNCVDSLSIQGAVLIDRSTNVRTYRLTQEWQAHAESLFAKLPTGVREYVQKCSDFVRQMSFTDLVSAIYREFPEMKANSVFRGPA